MNVPHSFFSSHKRVMVGRSGWPSGEHGSPEVSNPAFRPSLHGLRPARRPGVPSVPPGRSPRGREPRHEQADAHLDGNRREVEWCGEVVRIVAALSADGQFENRGHIRGPTQVDVALHFLRTLFGDFRSVLGLVVAYPAENGPGSPQPVLGVLHQGGDFGRRRETHLF